MERILKYTFLILIVFGYLCVHAQDGSDQMLKSKDGENASTVVISVPSSDPKLPADQGSQGAAQSKNPAKITTPMVDPKLPTEEGGSTIVKPPLNQQTDAKLEAISTSKKEAIPVIITETRDQQSSKANNEQPTAPAPKNIIIYRNINGSDSQPIPEKSAKEFNYRQIKGANDQPVGEKPKR
ncbi:MAG: hypothetical protein ACOYMF_06945 [Bacteroidales bacterium]